MVRVVHGGPEAAEAIAMADDLIQSSASLIMVERPMPRSNAHMLLMLALTRAMEGPANREAAAFLRSLAAVVEARNPKAKSAAIDRVTNDANAFVLASVPPEAMGASQ